MTINFKEFVEIKNTFNIYTEEFGPMTKETAINLCYFLEAVSQEEQAAGEYFSRR